MQDNDFWIGQEQIPVDLSLLLTYSNDEDYWYAPGEYALRVYTVDTLNTNFARPCFAFGERTSDPEMEDVSGAIENTLHELLDSGATPEDVYRIMGLVKESELSPETKEADSYLPIDLGYCIDGNIVSYEAVPEGVATVPENVDYPRYAEATAASLASEARDAKAARTELDSQSEIKDAPTRAEKADGSL